MQVLVNKGIYICPECGSKRITEVSQNVLIKMVNVNTGNLIDPRTGESRMSNRDKARAYDNATGSGTGCWFYECRKCGWKSDLCME